MKSFYNEKGEEISEWTWEDEDLQTAMEEETYEALPTVDTVPAPAVDDRSGAKSKERPEPACLTSKAVKDATKKPAIKKPSGAAAVKSTKVW